MKTKNRNARNLAGNVKDVNVQNGLIKEYLERQFLLDDETLNKVIEINNNVNTKITHEDTDNILWIPKKFEFSNMFSYGEGNKIEFDKAKGIIGLFAPNTQGKSSLFDSLSFCIFDKCSRAFKATHIMNNQKDTFSCKFNFEIDGIDYFIERQAHTTKTEKVKVNVNFWRVVDGVEESLNVEQRRDKNKNIEKYNANCELLEGLDTNLVAFLEIYLENPDLNITELMAEDETKEVMAEIKEDVAEIVAQPNVVAPSNVTTPTPNNAPTSTNKKEEVLNGFFTAGKLTVSSEELRQAGYPMGFFSDLTGGTGKYKLTLVPKIIGTSTYTISLK
jgi:hypothetical protein